MVHRDGGLPGGRVNRGPELNLEGHADKYFVSLAILFCSVHWQVPVVCSITLGCLSFEFRYHIICLTC